VKHILITANKYNRTYFLYTTTNKHNQRPAGNTRLCPLAGRRAISSLCARINFILSLKRSSPQTANRHSLGRYQTCKKKEKDDHDHKLMHIISVSKHSRDRNTETRKINIESVFETKKLFGVRLNLVLIVHLKFV